MNLQEIRAAALKEIAEEDFRYEVRRYKQKLREKKTLWDRIFPYKILIIKKGEKSGY